MDFIDLKTQYRLLKPRIDARIAAVLECGSYIMGPEVFELETRLADYCEVRHAVAVASGTDALLIAMLALEIKPGDEVITTPFSFVATVETIALLGAIPVFVDIDPRTYNLDPRLIEAAVTPRTRLIMPVSLYGQCADLDAINTLAERHGLPVVEDAAQSFGATYKGRRSCALSTIACTSFYPAKPLGCYGDGGACFTADELLAERMRQIRDHGQHGRYHHERIGVNGRMDTLQAAVLLAKLETFADDVTARARLGQAYSEALAEVGPALVTPYLEPHNRSVYAQYTVQAPGRDLLQQRLAERGVPTAVHYPAPLHLQPAFAYLGRGPGCFPRAEQAAQRVLSLPMHPYLTAADQQHVVHALIEGLADAEAGAA